jgi:hypothetical protein
MTVITTELETTATVWLDEERKRFNRVIALSSASLTGLIAIVATILAIVA